MSAVSVEHGAYLNHVLSCSSCYAPSARFCGDGQELRLAADAVFIAGLKDLGERRRWMASEEAKNPNLMPRLKELVAQKYKERANG